MLLHGYNGDPEKYFFPWLKKELENIGYKVNVPKLPNSSNPSVYEQTDYVLKNCDFDENTVLLGHSFGSVIALKVLEKLNKPIKKLILVAGFAQPGFKDKKRNFEDTFDWKFDFQKIRSNVKEVIILRAENDYAVKEERADFIKEKIGGTIFDFRAEKEHFTGDIEPAVLNNCLDVWPIFTTRADTIYGVTFMVISAQHPKLMELVTLDHKKEIQDFLKKIKSTSEKDAEELNKEGAFTGSYALNPITNEKIPIYAGNFVLADYGSGMIMAVPAHDERDFQFAKKYNIPIKVVISPDSFELNPEKMTRAYTGDGRLINSGEFNNWNNREAISEIIKKLKEKRLGYETVNYKLRDWLISRQRYWGTPIPIIYCERCGIVPVPEKDLPVLLPEKVKFGEGNPLLTNKEFVNTFCPRCKNEAKRETDTMDTFFDSSWYFLRFCDSKNSKKAFDDKKINYWMPVDQYIGGAEHACMHLIYARFFTKALRDIGLLRFDEPFIRLFNQGMLHGQDGFVMSKSRGNVVLPEEVSKKYGIDTARLFLVSIASPDKDIEWSENGIIGSMKFIIKLFEFFDNINFSKKSSKRIESKLNKTIKEISDDIKNFKYNLAVIRLRSLFEVICEEKIISKKDIEKFLKLLSPICPHISEELWSKIGNKSLISLEKWPKYSEKKIDDKIEKQEQILEKTIEDILNIFKIIKEKQNKDVTKVFIYVIPNEFDLYNEEILSKRIGKPVKIFSVNDKNKIDPEEKSSKAKPGKPGIYVV
ncbi:MAG: class I tRNA ligase family protein [Candidatus Pacearchaeota archaeon]